MPVITPTDSIQAAIDAHPAGTAFCLAAGVHAFGSGTPNPTSVTPKSGNIFTGQYGAILDGSAWAFTTLFDIQAAFKAHNQAIVDVAFRNLRICYMPARAIHAQSTTGLATGWLVEYCELDHNMYGLVLDAHATIRHNAIHHNVGDLTAADVNLHGGAFNSFQPMDWLIEDNEIAYNGPQGKIQADGARITVRRNWIHHQQQNGLWFDGIGTLPGAPNPGLSTIEDNRIEDNGYFGIYFEASAYGLIRKNTCRRNAASGIALGTSRDTTVEANTIEDNGRAISLYVSCDGVGFAQDYDLRNNTLRDNTIQIPRVDGPFGAPYANELQLYACSSDQANPYLTNTKRNVFERNHYRLPGEAAWWHWGANSQDFAQWQALLQDVEGDCHLY